MSKLNTIISSLNSKNEKEQETNQLAHKIQKNFRGTVV